MHCSKRLLSVKNFLESTKAPLHTFSITSAGTGGSAGEINNGEAWAAVATAGSENEENGVANKVAREGKCGPAAVAAEVIVIAGEVVTGAIEPDPNSAEESSGIDEIDTADGNDIVTIDVLLPVSGKESVNHRCLQHLCPGWAIADSSNINIPAYNHYWM